MNKVISKELEGNPKWFETRWISKRFGEKPKQFGTGSFQKSWRKTKAV